MKYKKNIKFGLILFLLIVGIVVAAAGTGNKLEPFTFVQMTDTQLGYGGYLHDVNSFKKAVELANNLKPDFVVFCGDFVDDFNDISIADFNAIRSCLTAPSYVSPGNHEMLFQPNPLRMAQYRKIFGKDYFSFKHKGYTIVIVNSQLWKSPLKGETEKMDDWFKKTLKEAKAEKSPIFVVQHIPLFLQNVNEDEEVNYNLPVKKRKELLALMSDCGVVAVLGGHTHQTLINKYKGIQLVNASAISKNDDGSPTGFRLWKVESPTSLKSEFIPLAKTAPVRDGLDHKDPNSLVKNK
jgi:serine/threonine-protein phosphatase CPPED1